MVVSVGLHIILWTSTRRETVPVQQGKVVLGTGDIARTECWSYSASQAASLENKDRRRFGQDPLSD